MHSADSALSAHARLSPATAPSEVELQGGFKQLKLCIVTLNADVVRRRHGGDVKARPCGTRLRATAR